MVKKRWSLGLVVTVCLVVLAWSGLAGAGEEVVCWLQPEWKGKMDQVKKIETLLSQGSGLTVKAVVAESSPEILAAFSSKQPAILYGGSFISTLLYARGLTVPLVHMHTGTEYYAGVMIYPASENPEEILKKFPEEISYSIGTSGGELSAKAATGGKARMGVATHAIAASNVMAGKARAAVVKNWWWEGNKGLYPDLKVYAIPGVSEDKNPDNLLSTSKVPEPIRLKIAVAAVKYKEMFGAYNVDAFDSADLAFTLGLFEKAQVDPLTYTW